MGKHKELQSLFDGLADAYRELEAEHDAVVRSNENLRGQLDDANKRITRQRRELRRLNNALRLYRMADLEHLKTLRNLRTDLGIQKEHNVRIMESNRRLRNTVSRYERCWWGRLFSW